jgi:hypothetical protein
MSNSPGQLSPDEISQLFAKLPPRDVAEFYASYQQWLRQQQIAQLQTRIANVRQQIAANDLQMQQAHPSAIALASLARLQSNGVIDLDLLDRMLERGDTWLDNTIQHLEYCEKFDFIRGNYTEWCEHALEGAYDWIDSMRKVSFAANALPQSAVNSPDQPPSQSPATTPTNNITDEALNEATEETFLQKLMSEEDISHLDIAQTLEIISLVNPIPADTLVEHRDPLDPTPVLIADTPVEHRDPLDPTPVLVDETPIPVDEPPTGAIENIADSTLIPVEEISTSTPEEALDSTLVSVEESPTTPAEHIPAAPSSEEPLPLSIAIPPDATTETETSSLTTARAAPSEQISSEDDKTMVPTPSSEELHTIEDSSDTSLPESKEDAPAPAQTTSTPSLLEDITQPLIPAQARQKEVSDIPPTLPEIPTMATPQSQQETGEPAASTDPYYTTNDAPWRWEAPLPSETSPPSSQPTTRESAQQTNQPPLPVAQPPKKRNFLQRLFSRRKYV